MKNLYPIVLIYLFTACLNRKVIHSTESQYQEKNKSYNVIDSISSIKFDCYNERPMEELLNHPLMVKYNSYQFIQEPTGCLWYFQLTFDDPNGKRFINVEIFPDMSTLKYIHRCINYPKETWDIASLKKETIAKVEFIIFD